MNKRYWLVATILCFALPAFAAEYHFDDTTIYSLRTEIKSGTFTCEQIISAYLQRIKEYNLSTVNSAPLNAFTTLNTQALDQARALDTEYKQTHEFKGALHCIPVIVKDNIDTDDMTSTSGSLAMLGNQPVTDAFLVERIRAAGGIIIGKGAMDEFAAGLSGISSRSGRVGNAFNQNLNSGGSSSGTAVAVAQNFALLGIGSDNSGSIRIPAAFNGLPGLRPSTGLISQHGIFPRGNMDGVAGPIGRDVHDLAVLLDVIAKADPQDPKTQGVPRVISYLSYLQAEGLRGKRIGIVTVVSKDVVANGQTEELTLALKDTKTILRQQGAIIVPDIRLPDFDRSRKNNEAGEYEDINDYLAAFPAVRKDYKDICESNRTRTFGKSAKACLAWIARYPKRNSAGYAAAIAQFKRNQHYVERVMNDNHLDALLMPITKTGVATYDHKLFNPITLSSNSGLPAITLNIGYEKENGMPMGIELTGKKFNEGSLLTLAYAFEQHSPSRTVPPLPEPNHKYASYALAELNNLFSRLGNAAYNKILKNGKSMDLTADKFRAIVEKTTE